MYSVNIQCFSTFISICLPSVIQQQDVSGSYPWQYSVVEIEVNSFFYVYVKNNGELCSLYLYSHQYGAKPITCGLTVKYMEELE